MFRDVPARPDYAELEAAALKLWEHTRAFERLPQLGVPVNELIDQLEPEGVTAFEKSYDSLLETLETRRLQMAGGK